MDNSQITDRLGPAIAHKFDKNKVYDEDKQKVRLHNEKFKSCIRESMKRRMQNPRHQASAKAMARLGWLITHPEFEHGKYPPSRGKSIAIPLSDLLSVDAFTFRTHLEIQFHSGMAWANYGKTWHIGHRVPIRLFDCTDPKQLIACFHYKNLQPELSEENRRRLNEVLTINAPLSIEMLRAFSPLADSSPAP